MATGPEHYREAEDWLTVAGNAVGKSSEHVVMAAAMVQAHAALALAAAVGTYGITDETRTAADANAWEYAAGEYTAQRHAERAAGPHPGRPGCEGCPECIGYSDPDEPDEPDDGEAGARALSSTPLAVAFGAAPAADLTTAMAQDSSSHGTAAVYDAADPHDAALAQQARAEYVDYAEAEAVREIEREMDRDAGDDSEIDQQVAEDEARSAREYEAHEANDAWLDAHPDDYVTEDGAL